MSTSALQVPSVATASQAAPIAYPELMSVPELLFIVVVNQASNAYDKCDHPEKELIWARFWSLQGTLNQLRCNNCLTLDDVITLGSWRLECQLRCGQAPCA